MATDRTATIILLHETTFPSWRRDGSTFCLALALMGVGWAADSAAMEWAGFIVFFLTVFARAGARAQRLTPQQAADFLARRFGVRAEAAAIKPLPRSSED